MVIDLVKNLSVYTKVFPVLDDIDQFMQKNPLAKLPLGITEIKFQDLFVNVMSYETHDSTERLESHRKYSDVHMIEGAELIRYLIHPKLKAIIAYDKKQDVEFFAEANAASHVLSSNYFMLFMPNEAHEPGCIVSKPEYVRKYVFKIRM